MEGKYKGALETADYWGRSRNLCMVPIGHRVSFKQSPLDHADQRMHTDCGDKLCPSNLCACAEQTESVACVYVPGTVVV